jgi:hypothetical protein
MCGNFALSFYPFPSEIPDSPVLSGIRGALQKLPESEPKEKGPDLAARALFQKIPLDYWVTVTLTLVVTVRPPPVPVTVMV